MGNTDPALVPLGLASSRAPVTINEQQHFALTPAIAPFRPGVMMAELAQEKTGLGNYFVANSPPFSAWKPEYLPAARAALDAKPDPDTALGLYLHIPFCRKRCKFCYFRVYTDKNADEVETYLSALSREIDLYADRRGLEGREVGFFFFGGGGAAIFFQLQAPRGEGRGQSP